MSEKHKFAFFTEDVALLKQVDHDYLLRDADVVRRLLSVVRVQPGDNILLFDDAWQVACAVIACTKKEITVRVTARTKHITLQPTIIFLLPLLEREAFEASLEALTVMGVTEIIPVITHKSRKKWGEVTGGVSKERDRARRLMIAAAEQSKQFVLPAIHKVVALDDAVAQVKKDSSVEKLFFDAQGKPAFDVLAQMKKNDKKVIVALVGPEGDLTGEEKNLVREQGFVFCKLTPTILRASSAVEVGMGLLRSCL